MIRRISFRYILVALAVFLSVHLILSHSNTNYARSTSLSRNLYRWRTRRTRPEYTYTTRNITRSDGTRRTANAVFVVLSRNDELDKIEESVRQMERRFNAPYGYPYVFLNDEEFTEEYKTRISAVTASHVSFGLIPRDHWVQPPHINETRARAARLEMSQTEVPYADSVPYRNMCRFNSGFFFRHPLLAQYRYYWRIEPGVSYSCDIDYDPFLLMQNENKVYGFTIALLEWEPTIPTLWQAVKEFTQIHPEYVAKDNALPFLSDDNGHTYNRCHFWSNFEIGDLDFWRGEAYTKFFNFLDRKGGFYYERWGDAPVHSIAAALFARRDQLHWFELMGYRHPPFEHCPSENADYKRGKCDCPQQESIDYTPSSCITEFEKLFY